MTAKGNLCGPVQRVDEATAALGAADPSDGFAAADLYYHGDITKCEKMGLFLNA
jgi:hypothetical protein